MTSDSNLVFDRGLIDRFDINGPRYTSYPTADRFSDAFDAASLARWLARRDAGAAPLSLYFHIPFCNTICYYCACNKIITKDHSRSAQYLDYVAREVAMQLSYLGGDRRVSQLHLGGGTPTFLSHDEMRRLMTIVNDGFELLPDGEYSIEVDPRKVGRDTVALLAELGFNRMSVGVQDFTPEVQRAVNRVQSFEETELVIRSAREMGFRSVSIDLIYGLPKQGVDTFDGTLDHLLALSPDRVSLYNYAHLPTLFMPQRRINEAELPVADVKLEILQRAIQRLTAEGYVYIGMDHFARPDDELAVAQRERRLHRNFQGYSTQAECDLLAFGVSAIGKMGASYAQNEKTTDAYYARIDAGELPVLRGIELNDDDACRRALIQELMCQFEVRFDEFGATHGIDVASYFAVELSELGEMADAGLVSCEDGVLRVLAPGRLLVRGVAMLFDRHLRTVRANARYSKVI